MRPKEAPAMKIAGAFLSRCGQRFGTKSNVPELARRDSLLKVVRPILLAALFAAPLAAPALAQTSTSTAATAPRIVDFSQADDAKIVTSYAAPGGVASGAQVSLESGALNIVNRAPGSFGVQLNIAPLDVDQITDLTFDFKASPDAKINWFFRVNGNYYAVQFLGPARVRPGAISLGNAQISDGKPGWKRAHIPLRAWLRSALPDAKTVVVDEVLVGNWDNDGYLLAGIGGNGPGANWQMDDLQLEHRVETAQFGPARWNGEKFVLPARDLANFDFHNLNLQIDGVAEVKDAGKSFVPDVGLSVDVGAYNEVDLKEGQSVKWKLTRADAVIAQGEVKLNYADELAPPLPTLLLDGAPVSAWNDMEFGAALWQSSDNSAYIEADDSTAHTGARSLRLTNKATASLFRAGLGQATLDAAQFPVLTFAYRADDRVRVDLTFSWDGKPYSARFLDRDNPDARVATIDDVKADLSWHTATVNLLESLQRARPDATNFAISDVQFSDAGWTGNARGVQWWLDDWRPAPRVETEIKATIVGRDLSGNSGVSYVLDQNPGTTLDETTRSGASLKIPLEGKTGLWWLHVRARDGAGKWSQTAHFPFWCGALPGAPVANASAATEAPK